MSGYWLNGYGYLASIYYGDILLYLPATLHLAGVDIFICYNIYIIFINGLTVIIAYICFKKIFADRNVAIILAAVYCFSNYRLSDIYYRGAVGEATAIVAYKKLNRKMLKISIIAVIILILSSNIFPWDFLVEHVGFFRFISAIQFPFRFIVISVMLLIFLSGVLLKELAAVKKIGRYSSDVILISILCLVTLFWVFM